MLLLLGALLILSALAVVLLLVKPEGGGERKRRRAELAAKTEEREQRLLAQTSEFLVAKADDFLKTSSRNPFGERELELADVQTTPGTLLVTVVAITATVAVFVATISGEILLGLILAALVPIGAKLWLSHKISARRRAFAEQLDEVLQIIASSLRAGHSFPGALDAVSNGAEDPAGSEFARIINENRIGRDLVTAMGQTAERMDSEDFRWVTEAVGVQRETGGNLNEIIDRVAATIRERRELRQEVEALSAEGRFSMWILMALPPVAAGAFSIINPGYIGPMFTTTTGQLVLACSIALYIVGGVWMRKVVEVEY